MKSQSIIRSLSIKEDFSPLLSLAIPLILVGLMQSSVSFFENLFLAYLGPQMLAAGALVTWLFATIIVILFGTFSAVYILIAHKLGADDTASISLILRDGFVLALILTAPTFLLVWNMSPIFLLIGQSQELVNLATAYLHASAWGLLPKLIWIVLYKFFLGLGHTRIITIFTMLTVPVYLFLSYILIFGKFGIPAFGIAGAGWGMTLGDWLATTCLCMYVFANKTYQRYVDSLFSFIGPSYLWEILYIGVPMGMMYCVEVGFFFAMTLLMGLISTQTLAANQIIFQYLEPLVATIFSIAQAITIRMGHQLGASQVQAAERTSYAGTLIVGFYMFVIALMYWFIPEVLIAIDFNVSSLVSAETVHYAKAFFYIAAFFQILEGTRIALFGSLRGMKDTRFTLLTSMISFWCVALPIGYVLSMYFKMGGIGYWYGLVVGATCSVILLYGRFKAKIRGYLQIPYTI